MSKSEDRVIQQFRDEKSMELFDKPECLLEPFQIIKLDQYIYDIGHPIWKDVIIKGKKTNYQVSNTGLVLNTETGNILVHRLNRYGYPYINIRFNGHIKTLIIHRLVAIAFIPNPENKPQVNHINGKKKFNWVGNLEWVTAKENTAHAIRTGLAGSIGITNSNNKYSEDQIHQVCYLLEQGLNGVAINKITGIPSHVTNHIKKGDEWIHISKFYNIKKPINRKRPDDMKKAITELIFAGYSNKEIVQYVGLPTTSNELEYVGLFRRRLLKRSSTIDQL